MTRSEKLRTMEALWEDLSKNVSEVESPPWHRDVLRETKARYDAGQEELVDWESAKRDLRKRFQN